MALTKKLPLLNSEAKQMRFLIGLYQEAENSQSVLKLRLAATNNAARLERAANEIKSIAGSLIMTIPDKKIGAFLASTRNMQMELHQGVIWYPVTFCRYRDWLWRIKLVLEVMTQC